MQKYTNFQKGPKKNLFYTPNVYQVRMVAEIDFFEFFKSALNDVLTAYDYSENNMRQNAP